MILPPHCLVQQSDQIAEIVCRSYSIGVKEAARALDMRDVALDPAVQGFARQAACAVSLTLCLDPMPWRACGSSACRGFCPNTGSRTRRGGATMWAPRGRR
jgi:hypothetical protein